jgi:hypothetical protein
MPLRAGGLRDVQKKVDAARMAWQKLHNDIVLLPKKYWNKSRRILFGARESYKHCVYFGAVSAPQK